MRGLICYSSETGNTKKLANGIYEGLSNLEIKFDIKAISEVTSIDEYEFLLIGYWVDKGTANKEALEFMQRVKGKKVGLFATLGAYADSDHAWKSLVNGTDLVKENNEVIGRFICQGKVSEKLIAMFRNLPDTHTHRVTKEKEKRYEIASKHPSRADIESAIELFRERLV